MGCLNQIQLLRQSKIERLRDDLWSGLVREGGRSGADDIKQSTEYQGGNTHKVIRSREFQTERIESAKAWARSIQSPSHDPVDWSMPVLPVPYYLPEFAQVHIHYISDTIQQFHPLSLSSSFPSIRDFPMSRLFISGGQSTAASASASVLPMNIQD